MCGSSSAFVQGRAQNAETARSSKFVVTIGLRMPAVARCAAITCVMLGSLSARLMHLSKNLLPDAGLLSGALRLRDPNTCRNLQDNSVSPGGRLPNRMPRRRARRSSAMAISFARGIPALLDAPAPMMSVYRGRSKSHSKRICPRSISVKSSNANGSFKPPSKEGGIFIGAKAQRLPFLAQRYSLARRRHQRYRLRRHTRTRLIRAGLLRDPA